MKKTYVTLLFFLASSILISAISDNKEFNSIHSNTSGFLLPDSTYEDSTETTEEYQFGDTISILTDGMDTTYILYQDSTTENMFIYDLTTIYLRPSSTPKAVNQNLYGINVSSMFEHTPLENNGMYEITPDPWELLSDLKPKVLRFPDGAGGKFSRMLGSENKNPADDAYGLWNGGYGFNLTEIIPYYDITDGDIDHADWTVEDVVSLNLADPGDDDWDWIEDQHVQDLIDIISHYIPQVKYDSDDYIQKEDEPLYINEFIKLIDKIETENPGHIVEVIVCLDVLNETAQQCEAIIDYLRTNNLHSVNVIGVELGNEVYSNFHGDAIGFKNYGGVGGKTAFEHYWHYLKGGDYSSFGLTGDFDLTDVLPDEMLAMDAHNYLSVLNEIDDLKIGIPAKNLQGGGFPFLTGDGVLIGPGADFWNEDLYDHYDEVIDGIPGHYAFDAVILHPYYTASNAVDLADNTNWLDIPLCLDADPDAGFDYFTGEWDYADYDDRLQCAFDDVIGIDDVTGNFRKVITTRHRQSYLEHNVKLNFDEFDDYEKELWTTEWNLLDTYEFDETDPEKLSKQQRLATFTNSFTHVYLLQEWFLRNLKINYQPEFSENFFTLATLQNFAGGSTLNLTARSDKQDQIELAIIESCTEDELLDYFVAKATYHEMDLISTISSNDLDYVSLTGTVFLNNLNILPTTFVDEDRTNLYVYYTNIKGEAQDYVLDPEYLIGFYPYADIVLLNQSPTYIHCIDADQLYSTSGRSSLHALNHFYDEECEEVGYYNNRFEIQGINIYENDPDCSGSIPTGGVCVTVPAYSSGYFIVPMEPYDARLGEVDNMFSIFPNPSSIYFNIKYNDEYADVNEAVKLEIINSLGSSVYKGTVMQGDKVDVTDLPVGVYIVKIYNKYNVVETEQMVKMK